jgi:L-2,4-diaminobutyric acid acetyltransferase
LFRETCAIVKRGSEIVGFLSACRKPESPDTLFVWQVAVACELRGKGIGSGMLRELLNRRGLEDIRYIEATIGPDNLQSRALFTGLAARRGCQCVIVERYPAEVFPQENGRSHEPEFLYRIGPLRSKERVLAHS